MHLSLLVTQSRNTLGVRKSTYLLRFFKQFNPFSAAIQLPVCGGSVDVLIQFCCFNSDLVGEVPIKWLSWSQEM